MEDGGNVTEVSTMTKILGAYGPVMLAHYKPNNGSQTTFDADIQAMLTPTYLSGVVANGLFAFSFMDNSNLSAEQAIFDFTTSAVQRFGRKP
jgi:hypothetical protein